MIPVQIVFHTIRRFTLAIYVAPVSTSTSDGLSLRGDNARETGEDPQENGDGKRSSEVETEETPIGPFTPHTLIFTEQKVVQGLKSKGRERGFLGDLEIKTTTRT